MEEQRGNESYELVVIIEEAQTMLQRVLSRMITDLIQRQTVGQQAKKIINDCLTKLKENGADNKLISEAERGLQGSFLRWYESTTTQLLQMAKSKDNPLFLLSYKYITGITPKADSKAMVINLMQVEGYEEGSIENIRDYFTTGEKGYSQMFIDDYQKRVNQEIHNIASRNVILRDSRNRRMSVRNLAEMEVRFQELIKDQERLKSKGVEYAYATSHSNASKRCSIWQGKLFILDGAVGTTPLGSYIEGYSPKAKGKIDGIEYYSLADAIGHGFLGYNCRHRMIAYRKGMTPPREYPAKFVDIERKREGYLRSLENQIRHAKRDYLLTDDKQQRKDLLSRSKALQELYKEKCIEYNYPIAEWRTRVSMDERNELPILENGIYPYQSRSIKPFNNSSGGNEPIIELNQQQEYTKEQLEAIEWYVSGEGQWINQYLRGKNDFGTLQEYEKELLNNLTEITNQKLSRNIEKLYRSVDAKAVFGNINYSEWENFERYMNYGEESFGKGAYAENIKTKVKDLLQKTTGKTIIEKGFMSTSKEYEVVAEWYDFTGSEMPIIIEFEKIPNGTKGLDISSVLNGKFEIENEEQFEVLLSRNTKYEITNIYAKNGLVHVKANLLKPN
ncbi:MAG: hypothetical protein J6R47_01705 [Acholeplasmatales bacterium]|nr:hypothetical protein [Acholeplasmatales bacterium]